MEGDSVCTVQPSKSLHRRSTTTHSPRRLLDAYCYGFQRPDARERCFQIPRAHSPPPETSSKFSSWRCFGRGLMAGSPHIAESPRKLPAYLVVRLRIAFCTTKSAGRCGRKSICSWGLWRELCLLTARWLYLAEQVTRGTLTTCSHWASQWMRTTISRSMASIRHDKSNCRCVTRGAGRV